MHARAFAAPPRKTAAPHRRSNERVRHRFAPQAESGAYPGQRGDRRNVPRADVRVERRRENTRRVERLRAEIHAVKADEMARRFRRGYVHAETHYRKSRRTRGLICCARTHR